MESIIDDVLTIARQGRPVESVTAVDVADIASRSWQTVDTGRASLTIEIDRTIPADEGRLQQLFENLIRNAVEHAGDRVTVTIGDLPDSFYFADDGSGIPPDVSDRVFDAGYTTTDEGTGFGLKIVDEIVKAHGWEIDVVPSDEGGTRFEITGVEELS